METVVYKLIGELHLSLQLIASQADDELMKSKRSYYASCAIHDQLKAFVIAHGFANQNEEQQFFRIWKPEIQKEVFYWKELIDLELCRPRMNRNKLRVFYKRQLDYYDNYLSRNQYLLNHYKLDAYPLEQQEFPKENPYGIPDTDSVDMETSEYTSIASLQLSRIMAYEQAGIYIQEKLAGHSGQSTLNMEKNLHWTGSKAQFIELVYALHAAGCIASGNTDIKQTFGRLSAFFNLKVTNYYGYFNTMAIRKKERTPFLNKLSLFLTQRMDEQHAFKK
jgi:hypothetical protein